jgi:hypothetical protein
MLIFAWTMSIMVTNDIQSFGILCDNGWRTRWRSFFWHFLITMNAMGIPFCHSSNTIIVYRRYYKKHNARLIGWMLQNIKVHSFKKWKTMPYPALIGAKCCVKCYWTPLAIFCHHITFPYSLNSQGERGVILVWYIEI